jgi:hypothetical protein
MRVYHRGGMLPSTKSLIGFVFLWDAKLLSDD